MSGTGHVDVKNNRIDTQTYTPGAPTVLAGTITSTPAGGASRIEGTGTSFDTDFQVGDIIVSGASEDGIVNIESATRLFIEGVINVTAAAYSRADRITVNGYNQNITINASTNQAAITLPDLTENSQGHVLKITKTGNSLVTIIPTSYSNGVFRKLINANSNLTLQWNGSAWFDIERRPSLAHLNSSGLQTIPTGVTTKLNVWQPVGIGGLNGSTGGISLQGSTAGIEDVIAPFDGLYRITAGVRWNMLSVSGVRSILFRVNSGFPEFYVVTETFSSISFPSMVTTGTLHLSANDTVSVYVFQNSGVNDSTNNSTVSEFVVEYLGEFN